MIIVDLIDEKALDISLTGGKGSELANLIKYDFPVPSGFVVTTKTFQLFIDTLDFDEKLDSLFDFETKLEMTDIEKNI